MTRIQRRINVDGMPIARLADVQESGDDSNPDGTYYDIAYAIFYDYVRPYRTALLAGDHNDIELTAESLRLAIARALKRNAVQSQPAAHSNDICGNG